MNKTGKILLVLLVLAAILAGGYFWLDSYAQKEGEARVAAFFEQVKDVAQAEYGDVDVDVLGMAATIRDMKLSLMDGQHFTVQEFTLRDYEEIAGLPSVMDVSVHGVDVPVTPENFEELSDTFKELGHLSVTMDFDLNYAFDKDKDTFELKDLSLTLRDMGSLGMGMKLNNVDLQDLVSTEGASAMVMALDSIELRYKDNSLFEQLIKGTAKEEGKTVEQVKAEAEAALAEEIAVAVAEDNQFAVDALDQVREFLRNPGTLSISVKPDRPVGLLGLLDVENTADVISRLNIRIEAK